MQLDPFLLLGILGMACILLAFLMVQLHKWSPDDFIYDLTNVIGSVALVAYAFDGKAWPFVILNTVWGLYSLRDVLYVDRMPGARKKITKRPG